MYVVGVKKTANSTDEKTLTEVKATRADHVSDLVRDDAAHPKLVGR